MRRSWNGVLGAAVLYFAGAAGAAGAAGPAGATPPGGTADGEAARPFIVLEAPEGVATEDALVEYGLYGKGLCLIERRFEKGSRRLELSVEPSVCSVFGQDLEDPRSAKAVAYFPGFRVVALELDWDEVRAPTVWRPDLERLATAPVYGRVVGPTGEPLKGRTVRLDYFPAEMAAIFGSVHGMVPRFELGRATSDADGRFWVEVPWLLGDAFFKSQFETDPGRPAVPNSAVEVTVGSWSTRRSLDELYDQSLVLRVEGESPVARPPRDGGG